MNYKIDDKLIYDDKAMWSLALSFKCRYEFIKGQVERSEKEKPYSSILFEGKVVMQWDSNYKKILSAYKTELKFMNNFFDCVLVENDNTLKKYIVLDS